MKYEIKENQIVIDHDHKFKGKTIEEFLEYYRQSKKNKYLLIQNQEILLDDQIVKSVQEKINDQTVTLILPTQEIDWIPADHPCKAVYEDPFLLIVHKENGIIIHNDIDKKDCLNAQVAKYYMDHNIHTTVRPIHRLDKDTEGLVIYSKIPFFQPWLDEQLSLKKIKRHYLAICYGECEVGKKFACSEKLGRNRHLSNQYRVSSTGKDALTKVTCLAEKEPYVLLGCDLETGRTHQIRVHLSHHHYPIVNDPLYGKRSDDFNKMGLFADFVEFINPISNKKHKIIDYDVKCKSYFEN